MITRNLFVAAVATSLLVGGASAAFAKKSGGGSGGGTHAGNVSTAYVCSLSPPITQPSDAISTFVNKNNALWNELETAANGNDSAGFEVVSGGTNNAIGPKFLTFSILGKAGSPSPMIQITDMQSNMYLATLKDGTKTAAIPGGESYSFSASQFSPTVPPGAKLAKIDFQLDPAKVSAAVQVGGVRVNGSTTTVRTTRSVDQTCPVVGP